MKNSLSDIWKRTLDDKKFMFTLAVSLILLIALLVVYSNFLLFIESREGIRLSDAVLKLFQPVNVTWFTFIILYVGLIAGIIILLSEPDRFLLAIQAYIILILTRMAAMYLVPLEPPATMIALKDPLVEIFGTGKLLTKDLFFSGHTATLFLIFLVVQGRLLKSIFLICTIAVGILVLIQHVHYTIDVYVAPFFAYGSYKISEQINGSLLKNGK
ncbi:MAG: phosphatase PAP2-related protein [Bacteroidota bacterium]